MIKHTSADPIRVLLFVLFPKDLTGYSFFTEFFRITGEKIKKNLVLSI